MTGKAMPVRRTIVPADPLQVSDVRRSSLRD
jgi:hypothetical protein